MAEVSVVPFKYKYLQQLIELHEANKYPHTHLISMKTLPKIGYISLLNGQQPLAAGFLRRLEGGYAQIDTLVSNPYFGSLLRHEGIKLVVDTLLEEAKRLDLTGIVAFTNDQGVLKRAENLGFVELNQKVIALNLTK